VDQQLALLAELRERPPPPPSILEPPPPPKQTRKRISLRAVREAAEAQRAAADKRWQDKARERQIARGAIGAGGVFPRAVRVMVTDILADPSGRAVLVHAATLRRSFSGVPLWAIVRAALGPRDDGQVKRTWCDERARKIAALGFAMLMCSRPTSRRSQWRHIVRGQTHASWQALLRSPFERSREPSRTTLAGRTRSSVGYLVALREAGFLYAQQLPASEVEDWERGVDRKGIPRAFNRYWLVGLSAHGDLETQLRLHAWHAAGWEVADQPPTARAPRDRAPP
jgi:hypothetical protein